MKATTAGQETTTVNPLSKLSLSALLSVVSAYSVAVGASYLWGYWSPFDINILDYMGLSEILAAAAWPLFGLFTAMLAGMLIGGGNAGERGVGETNRVGKVMLWYWGNLRELHFFGLFLIWILEVPNKWYLIALFGGTPLSVYVMQSRWMEYLRLPRQVQLILVFFIITAPLVAIAAGQKQSEHLLNGRVYKVIYSDLAGVPVPSDAKPEARLRLIGQRGDTLFIWEPQLKRTVIAKFPNDHPLVLGRINTVTTGTGWEAIVQGINRLLN